MIYLDNGATTLHKPASVIRAVAGAISRCANPGRGGYPAAMAAADAVYRCRETAAKMFDCQPEQVAFTSNCTHGLNIAISTLVQPGDSVVMISDGVASAEEDGWVKTALAEYDGTDPKALAARLMEESANCEGAPDDRTTVVLTVKER